MKVAVWSRVASAIKQKFGVSWERAKQVYQQIRTKTEKPPSLRLVKALPDRVPKKYTPTAPHATPPREVRPRLPPSVKYAPPAEKREPAKPRRVAHNQKHARNYFEQELLKRGLPVRAIADSVVGQDVVQTAETKTIQRNLAAALKRGHDEIKKNGGMSAKTKDRVLELMTDLFGDGDALQAWHGILKRIYA